MSNEEAISVLSILECDLSAEYKEYGYTYERYELMEALNLAIDALRKEV